MEDSVEPIEVAQAENPLLFCNRTYGELVMNASAPYNAVGYLSNGCTAFLIDATHIAANAHCFVDQWGSGEWQTVQRGALGLTFYPNFHPSRVTGAGDHVPRAAVARAVVGTRQFSFLDGDGTDWAIAKLSAWQDVSGVNLTPLPLNASTPAGTNLTIPVTNPSYTRHHYPYNDSASPHWDDMVHDRNTGGVFPNNTCGDPGIWIVKAGTPPAGERNVCNERWATGYVHDGCQLRANLDDVLHHSCDFIGGGSGSPIISLVSGQWAALGIGRRNNTESWNYQAVTPCTTYDPNDYSKMNYGPSARRFIEAPRFAHDIATGTSPISQVATAVYAVDSDRNVVVTRARVGTTPTQSSEFGYWTSLGTPDASLVLDDVATCAHGARPQVFVTAGTTIRQRVANADGTWGGWSTFLMPAGVTTVYDIDTATDGSGWCQFYAVTNDGLYTRTKTGSTTWGSWARIGASNGTYRKVSGLAYDFKLNAAVVDTAGQIWRASSPMTNPLWTSLSQVAHPGRTYHDVDFTLDEQGRGFMVALSSTMATDGQLRFLQLFGAGAWTQWLSFQTSLFPSFQTKVNGTAVRPNLKRINASWWMETVATLSPVIFATDDQGNVYFIEFTRVGTGAPGWVLEWKSFYHEQIPYWYACSDGLDNDGDGKIDFTGNPMDPGCTSATDITE